MIVVAQLQLVAIPVRIISFLTWSDKCQTNSDVDWTRSDIIHY